MTPSSDRVSDYTAARINQRIRKRQEAIIAYYAEFPEEIDDRLAELDREWDIERVLQTNASVLGLLGIFLGARVDRRFFLLPALVGGFLFQHSVQGWCPPVPALRRLGVRTMKEIEEERYALKYLRGDFGDPPPANGSLGQRVKKIMAAVRREYATENAEGSKSVQ